MDTTGAGALFREDPQFIPVICKSHSWEALCKNIMELRGVLRLRFRLFLSSYHLNILSFKQNLHVD